MIIHAPFLDTDLKNNFIRWEEVCVDGSIIPFESYLNSVNVGMGSTRFETLLLDSGIPEVTGKTPVHRLRNTFHIESAALEEYANAQNRTKVEEIIRNVLVPLSIIFDRLKIPIEENEDNQSAREKVISLSQKQLGVPNKIDPQKQLPGLEKVRNEKKTKK